MIIYADENVPQKIATRMRAEGHQVEYVTSRVEDYETNGRAKRSRIDK